MKVSAQDWLNEYYPENGVCKLENDDANYNLEIEKITYLYLKELHLCGDLDLSRFTELNDLDCSGNFLESLNVSNCPKLAVINCSFTTLEELDLSKNSSLTEILFANNKVFKSKLKKLIFSDNCKELTDLNIEYNPQCKCELSLKNCKKLERVCVNGTPNVTLIDLPNNCELCADPGYQNYQTKIEIPQ